MTRVRKSTQNENVVTAANNVETPKSAWIGKEFSYNGKNCTAISEISKKGKLSVQFADNSVDEISLNELNPAITEKAKTAKATEKAVQVEKFTGLFSLEKTGFLSITTDKKGVQTIQLENGVSMHYVDYLAHIFFSVENEKNLFRAWACLCEFVEGRKSVLQADASLLSTKQTKEFSFQFLRENQDKVITFFQILGGYYCVSMPHLRVKTKEFSISDLLLVDFGGHTHRCTVVSANNDGLKIRQEDGIVSYLQTNHIVLGVEKAKSAQAETTVKAATLVAEPATPKRRKKEKELAEIVEALETTLEANNQ